MCAILARLGGGGGEEEEEEEEEEAFAPFLACVSDRKRRAV
jgi:hypothetical protein